MAQKPNKSQQKKFPAKGTVKKLIDLFEETFKSSGVPRLTPKTRGWKSSPSMNILKFAIPSSVENGECDSKNTGPSPRVSLIFPGLFKDKSTQTSRDKLYMSENEIEGLCWLFKPEE